MWVEHYTEADQTISVLRDTLVEQSVMIKSMRKEIDELRGQLIEIHATTGKGKVEL